MKTRKQLEMLGVLLLGPIVALWFKLQSDGASVPGGWLGRKLFITTQWTAAAFIHDYEYFLIGLQWPSPKMDRPPDIAFHIWQALRSKWVGARIEADRNLKENRKLCAKNKFIGWAYARIIFRGLRVGGRGSILLPDELVVPPDIKAINDVERDCQFPVTEQAAEQIAKWKRMRRAEDIG